MTEACGAASRAIALELLCLAPVVFRRNAKGRGSMIGARRRVSGAAIFIWMLLLGGPTAHAQTPAEDDSSLVARGEYLARAADCLPCHSGDKSKPYGGGLPLNTPFGTIFSVNITSDSQT